MGAKTKIKSVQEYFSQLEEPRKSELKELHKLITTTAPELKPTVDYVGVGYGSYHYKYATGREGDCAVIGLSSRANYISVYAMIFDEKEYVIEKFKKDLPKANIGKCCIRFRHLSDIDQNVMKKIIQLTAESAKKMNYNFVAKQKK